MTDLAAAPAPVAGRDAVEDALESHRVELTGYCYRMLGSSMDAEDAVQETLVRAWRRADSFEGRSSVRSWLFRIATNVCLDMLTGAQRRIRPVDMGPAMAFPGSEVPEPSDEDVWVLPAPDSRVIPTGGDPADVVVARETVRLAFVAALQHLPPKQRAVLILREVLRMKADEVATLLDTSVASVNSALQRARATLSSADIDVDGNTTEPTEADKALLDRYVDAFERYDVTALTELLREDAVQSMPPYEMWLSGRDSIIAWWFGPGIGCKGSKLVPVHVNGQIGFGQYRPSGPGGRHEPWAIQVPTFDADGRIVEFTSFLDTSLFPYFGLPDSLQ